MGIKVTNKPVNSEQNTNGATTSWNYYPYGSEMTMTAPSQLTTNPDWQAYRFSGKELIRQNGLNMYDFGARLFDVAGVPMWTSMDPLCEKYYHISPYAYCAGDPVNKFDPDGMDEWNINEKGEIVKYTKTDKHDAFYIVDSENNRIEDKSLIFEYGTIEESGTRMDTQKHSIFNYYGIKGDDNSNNLFEFMSKNTSVEWSEAKMADTEGVSSGYITTSFKNSRDFGMRHMVETQLRHYSIYEINHSHPSNSPNPSGLWRGSGDVQFANYINNITQQNISYKIFLPLKDCYIPLIINTNEAINIVIDPIIVTAKRK